MADKFTTWLMLFCDQLRAFAQPEGGFTRNHPKHGPSGVVSEQAIEQIVYASMGKLMAYRNAVLKMIQAQIELSKKDIEDESKKLTTWRKIFLPRTYSIILTAIAVRKANLIMLQYLETNIKELDGNHTDMIIEELKLAKRPQ